MGADKLKGRAGSTHIYEETQRPENPVVEDYRKRIKKIDEQVVKVRNTENDSHARFSTLEELFASTVGNFEGRKGEKILLHSSKVEDDINNKNQKETTDLTIFKEINDVEYTERPLAPPQRSKQTLNIAGSDKTFTVAGEASLNGLFLVTVTQSKVNDSVTKHSPPMMYYMNKNNHRLYEFTTLSYPKKSQKGKANEGHFSTFSTGGRTFKIDMSSEAKVSEITEKFIVRIEEYKAREEKTLDKELKRDKQGYDREDKQFQESLEYTKREISDLDNDIKQA